MISITDSVSATKNIYFKLTDPVDIPGLKVNGDDIELVFDTTNKDKLIAFRILVLGPDLQDNIFAYQKAYRLTNLLTLKTGKFIFHERPVGFASNEIGQEAKSIGQPPIKNTLVNLDITDPSLQSKLDNDSRINLQLAHFSNGIKAFEAANFGEAIKEFYQVIEYDTPQHLEKYKSLRHGLSHAELSNPNTISDINNDFGIICIENPSSTCSPKGKYVNISDPKVQVILQREANYLHTEIYGYLDPKVGIKTD